MTKRATRFKVEFFIDDSEEPAWDALVTEMPPTGLLPSYVTCKRTTPKKSNYSGPVYSELDPQQSVDAAIEHAERRDTKRGAVLMMLINRNGLWQTRSRIRAVGGDSGDRRVRELRDQGGWPIEIKQFHEGDTWQVRMNMPGKETTRAINPHNPPEDVGIIFGKAIVKARDPQASREGVQQHPPT